MKVGKLDKLVRKFLNGTSNPHAGFDVFNDLQDPTFMSFKLDFFPDNGMNISDDARPTGGLFRKPPTENSAINYEFQDSAADYLKRIGAPTRQVELEIFINLLKNIQDNAPWYFQSVSGLADLYKIDPANNFRGKDKVLTIDCLESVDMRLTLLADLYRGFAFDVNYMREVLPVNLRRFNMRVHVLEMRRFNTTFGIIADHYAKDVRPIQGQSNQNNVLDAQRRNVFEGNSSLFSGTFNNISDSATNLNTKLGGVFSNQGSQSGPSLSSIESAFEAISVQTFDLNFCEFDFYSEAPPYLDNVSNKEAIEAAFRFKIKVGKIKKITTYPFYNFIVAESTASTRIPKSAMNNSSLGRNAPTLADHYFEETPQKELSNEEAKDFFGGYREGIYPTESGSPGSYKKGDVQMYSQQKEESDNLKRQPLERLLGGILNNATSAANEAGNVELGKATSGILGTAPLGNVFDKPTIAQQAANSLNGFLNPGSQLTTGQIVPPAEKLSNIAFEAITASTDIPKNVNFDKNPSDTFTKENVFSDSTQTPTKNSIK